MWFTCLWPVNSWRMQIQGRDLSFCYRGGEKPNPSRCIITRRLNKNFQNAVLYSTKRDQSAFKNIKGGAWGGSTIFSMAVCEFCQVAYPYCKQLRPTPNTGRFLVFGPNSTSSLVHAALRCCSYFLKPTSKWVSRKQTPFLLVCIGA